MTYLAVQVDGVDDSSGNAILGYEYDFFRNGITSRKVEFKPVATDPEPQSLFHRSSNLDAFVRESVRDTAVPGTAVLYSPLGFSRRNSVKDDLENKITLRTFFACCLTCGLALCCAGCCCRKCGACDVGEKNLNESHYLAKLEEMYPGETREVRYEFATAGAPMATAKVMDR